MTPVSSLFRDKLPESIKSTIQKDIRDAVIRICTEKEPKESTIIQNNQTEISIGKLICRNVDKILFSTKNMDNNEKVHDAEKPGQGENSTQPKSKI